MSSVKERATTAGAANRSTVFRQWLLALVAVALVGGVGAWLGSPSSGPSRLGEFPLMVDPDDADFGEVWEQDRFHWTLPIKNRSSEDIEIRDIVGSCSCYSIDRTSFIIPAGRTEEITLTLDLTASSPSDATEEIRSLTVFLRAIIRGRRAPPPEWPIKGRVRRSLVYAPAVVRFEETLIRGQPFPSQKVLVSFPMPLKDVDVQYDKLTAQVDYGRTEHDGAQFELRITPKETLATGPFQFFIRVAGVFPDGTALPAPPLECTGVLVRDIFAIPDVVHFLRDSSDDGPAEVMIVLQSRSQRRFAVEQVLLEAENVGVLPLASPTASEHSFRIVKRGPPGEGSSGKIIFLLRDESGKQEDIDLPLGRPRAKQGGVSP